MHDEEVVRQMEKAALDDPAMAELSAASESMAAIIDSYSKANFLDKNGNKDTTTSVDKDQVLKAVTDKYKKQNKIAHKMFDTVVAALKKKKYEPKGARFRATKWDTDLMPFHKLRNKAMSRPGYDHKRWSRRKRKIRLKSWRKWANNLIVQSVEAVKNHDFAKESQILKALGRKHSPRHAQPSTHPRTNNVLPSTKAKLEQWAKHRAFGSPLQHIV